MVALAIVFAIAGAVLAALCAAADGALLSLDAEGKQSLPEHLRALVDRRERTHRALAFARVVGQLTAGIALARALQLAALPLAGALAIAVVVAAASIVAAESFARTVGDALGDRAANTLLPLILSLERILAPVGAVAAWLERSLDRLMPPRDRDAEALMQATAEHFREVVAAEADVSRQDERLLHGVFTLGTTEVHEIMVPRIDVVGIERSTPWSQVVDRVRSSEHARFPVYVDTIDEIGGVLYAKDLLPSVIAGTPPEGGWATLIRPATFIPRTKTLDEQLRAFQSSRTHIAIVVDEYGGTAGLVTIEDILEEIVGEIRDEYDVEEAPVEQRGGGRYWVSGRVTLDELSELLGHDFSRVGVTTVGGLVYELLGRVPAAGEEFFLNGFRVVVEQVVRRRIGRVYFERTALVGGRAE